MSSRFLRTGRWPFLMVVLLMLAACAETQFVVHSAKRINKAQKDTPDSTYKVGKPYQIKGVWYYPKVDYRYVESGIASWYGSQFHGKATANGEIFNMNDLSAAHRTLPLPSIVRVTNLDNGRSLNVRVNDRGPFAHGRIIDMSRRAAQLLGFQRQGTARVRVEILAQESRALAVRMRGETELASIGTPITVDKLPKPVVSAQQLPPPGSATPPPPIKVATLPPPAKAGNDAAASPDALKQSVRQGKAVTTQMYVQAGAFAQYNNANRARARLSALGPVKISSVLVDGRDLFRVRVGPLKDVSKADQFLDQVIGSGYTGARIVIE